MLSNLLLLDHIIALHQNNLLRKEIDDLFEYHLIQRKDSQDMN